jgi:hypothetical protein
MNPQIPFYLSVVIFLITAILICAIFYALNFAYSALNYTPHRKNRAFIIVSALLLCWLIVSSAITFSGTLIDFNAAPPRMLLILIPAVLAIVYISSSTRVNAMLDVIPPEWLVYVQSFRVLMELLLWLMFAAGVIPIQMTFEGLNYDILAGLSAPLVAYYALSTEKWPQIAALLWNFAGFLLVVNISIISIVSAPGPLRQFTNEPANTMVAYFPFVWIPAFIVPFAILMHVLSIKQIIRGRN